MKDTFNIFGKTKETIFKSVISSSDTGQWVLLNSIPNLIELEVFDGIFLEDNIIGTESEKLDLENGIYKCDIKATSYKSNHPLDPVDWELDITIDNIELIITLP